MFGVPVKTLFPGAVFVRAAQDDDAPAGDPVDHGKLGLRAAVLEGFGVGSACERGRNQAAVADQGQAEQVDPEDGGSAAEDHGRHGDPFDPPEKGPDGRGEEQGHHGADHEEPAADPAVQVLKVFFRKQRLHRRILL